ncbi:hypothetical protein [Demequina aestuarii]|uniref:hypothetical protein n=1 Tax=Demequina aestuarii TaxID=327095 RepID=UPI000A81B19A|nr:hypothetical protein [Demequina aestuarii]
MVAAVLGLKARVLRHQLRREWWRALLLLGGVVWSLSLIPATFWVQRYLSTEASDVRATLLVGFATVCVAGWLVVPLLVTGLEDALDPGRFASLGVQARRLMPGLTIAAALTLPTLFFVAVFLILAGSWRYAGGEAVTVASVGGLLTVALMVVTARVAVAWSGRLLSSRRSRWGAFAGLVVVAAGLGPAVWLTFRDGVDSALAYEIPVILEWLGRTPVGAGMAAPGALAQGDVLGAVWRLALLAATVAVVHGAWRANVEYTLVHPTFRGAGTRRRGDAVLDARQRATGDGIAAAVRSRSLIYWRTDPRYLVGAIGVIALPLVFFALAMPVLGLDQRWGFAAPVMLAASIGWGRHNDVAYDSTALHLDIVAGRVGRAVMTGRTQAVLVWAVPLVALAALGLLAWTGQWDAAPGLIGACTGALGLTLGISAVTSVLLPYRAPAPGQNPFGAEVGAVGASLVAQLVSGAAMAAALPIVTVAFVLSLTADARWGWLALVAGTGLGVAGALAGVRAAGALYDRRAGRLLAAVS